MTFPVEQIIFYCFALMLIVSATLVIVSKNPVKSVLFLIACFFSSAVLWMLLQAEFLSLVLIFVYVGAVMTLFLFVVMMLNIDKINLKPITLTFYPIAFLVLVLFVGMTLYVLSQWLPLSTSLPNVGPHYNNVVVMGTELFTTYLFPFEICAILLLVGMISAIVLTHQGKRMGTRSQVIANQLAAKKEDRLKIVDLKSTPTEPL